jgi:hypothetical protein
MVYLAVAELGEKENTRELGEARDAGNAEGVELEETGIVKNIATTME